MTGKEGMMSRQSKTLDSRSKALGSQVKFDGRFTDQIRRLLHNKRVQLGLPYHRAARFMGVNWSTFRKWEMGPTTACGLYYRGKLENFINGAYDQQLQELYQRRHITGYSEMLPNTISECMERVTNAYRLCRLRPELRQTLLQKVDSAAVNVLQNLITIAPDELASQFLASDIEAEEREQSLEQPAVE